LFNHKGSGKLKHLMRMAEHIIIILLVFIYSLTYYITILKIFLKYLKLNNSKVIPNHISEVNDIKHTLMMTSGSETKFLTPALVSYRTE